MKTKQKSFGGGTAEGKKPASEKKAVSGIQLSPSFKTADNMKRRAAYGANSYSAKGGSYRKTSFS